MARIAMPAMVEEVRAAAEAGAAGPHFLVVTYPAQGHINPARHLARRLLRATGARVTISTAVSAFRKMFPGDEEGAAAGKARSSSSAAAAAGRRGPPAPCPPPPPPVSSHGWGTGEWDRESKRIGRERD